ncbi:MAG: hypothetical protein KGI60_02445 [Patescibacteria group bacterium]|nr:hypothetical protein [Patescibacteria group bacterium]
METSKNIKTLITLTILALIGVGTYYLVSEKVFIPTAFTEARVQNAKTAESLIAGLNASLDNLKLISQYDQKNDFADALKLTKTELSLAVGMHATSTQLANDLSAMATAAQGITPTKARDLAISAATDELSLIGKLIVYNDSLSGLFQTLTLKFSGSIPKNADEVAKSIQAMNATAQDINALNDSFNAKMAEFDTMTK